LQSECNAVEDRNQLIYRLSYAIGRLCFLITITFFILRLTHNVSWSWWWVFSPVWIPAGGFAVFVLFCLIMAALFNRGSKPTKETP
jgi:hypothetical protein